MGKSAIIIVLSFLGFATLTMLGYFFKFFDKFDFKYEIQVVDALIGLLTLGVTIWLAYWATNIIEKARDLNKNEREIVLLRIADLIKAVEGIIESIYSEQTSTVRIASTVKQIATINNNVLFIITNSQSIPTDTQFHHQIHLYQRSLNVLMTLYPSPTPLLAHQIEPVQVVSDKYVYTEDRKVEIEQNLNSIKEHLSLYTLFVIQS